MVVSSATAQVVDLIYILLTCLWICYCISSLIIDVCRIKAKDRPPLANLLWYWSKWPALLLAAGSPVYEHFRGDLDMWDGVFCAWYLFVWWSNKDKGDDDDHKKLENKLKEKVVQMGNKLVIVPEPA